MQITSEQVDKYFEGITTEVFEKHCDYFRFFQAKKRRVEKKLQSLDTLLSKTLPLSEKLAKMQGLTLDEFSKTDPPLSEVESEWRLIINKLISFIIKLQMENETLLQKVQLSDLLNEKLKPLIEANTNSHAWMISLLLKLPKKLISI